MRKIAGPLLAVAVMLMASCGDDDVADVPPSPPATDAGPTDITDVETPAIEELLAAGARTHDEPRLTTKAHGVIRTTGSPPRRIEFSSTTDLGAGRGEVAVVVDDERVRMIADGDRFWITDESDAFTGPLPPGKLWVLATLADVKRSVLVAPLQQSVFSTYVAGATAARRHDDRISFDLDLDRAAAAAPEHRRHDLLELVGATDGHADANGEATIAPSGHLGRVTVDVKVADSDAAPTTAHWEMEFSDFGRAVEIQAPPSSAVVPLADVPELGPRFFGDS